jgi:recombinational DNA repair protein RecT
MKHVYVYSFNVNVGTKDNPKWEKRASRQISPYGELLLRTIQGQIKYVDNPVVVYQGDEWAHGERDGKKVVNHMAKSPRESDNIIAVYLKITRHDDTIDYKVLTAEEIQDLRKVSKSPNSSAWVKSFKGMCEAKVIKHAFKTYPKVRVGEFSKMASDIVDTEPEMIIPDYGVDLQSQNNFTQDNGQQAPADDDQPPITPHTDENSFADEPAQQTEGTQFKDDEEF